MSHPRKLDMDLVNAQQARRILDRIVGYKLSPFLWKKVRPGLSAGRVQSVTVRMIVDRENEIRAFVSEEYWSVRGEAHPPGPPSPKRALSPNFTGSTGKKLESMELKTKADADRILAMLEGAQYQVTGPQKGHPQALARPALHHLHPPAGGLPQAQLPVEADDVGRPDPL